MEHKANQFDTLKRHFFASGGLFSTIEKMVFRHQPGIIFRCLFFAAITWLPLFLISVINGTFMGENVALSFSEDFIVHLRLLVVVPLFIWAEKIIDPAYDHYIDSSGSIIAKSDLDTFNRITNRLDTLSSSWLPEAIILLLIFTLYAINWQNIDLSLSRWSFAKKSGATSIAGLYYIAISIPIYQFLLARWLWRWILWVVSIFSISRLELQIDASHADQMAGLEFMRLVPAAFTSIAFGIAVLFSATIGETIIFQSATLKDNIYAILFFVISIPIAINAPLCAFLPALVKAKVRAVTKFGGLLQRHNNLYYEKWMREDAPKDKNILGALDNSSMADINGSYQQSVKEMHLIPMTRQHIIQTALILLLPFLPLLLTMYTFSELVNKLANIVAG